MTSRSSLLTAAVIVPCTVLLAADAVSAAPECLLCRNIAAPTVLVDDVIMDGVPSILFTAVSDGAPPDESLVFGIEYTPGGNGNADTGDVVVQTAFQATALSGSRFAYGCHANIWTAGSHVDNYVAFAAPYAGGYMQLRPNTEAMIVSVSGGPTAVTSSVGKVKGFTARYREPWEQNSRVAIGYAEGGVVKVVRNSDVNPFFCGNDGVTTLAVCSASSALKIASVTPDLSNSHNYNLEIKGGTGKVNLNCNLESGCPAVTVGANLTVTCADIAGAGLP